MKIPQLTIRATLLIIVAVLNILIAVLVGRGVYESLVHYRQAQALKNATGLLNDLYNANKYLSLSRATSLSVIYAKPNTDAAMREYIHKNRVSADALLDKAFVKLHKENKNAEALKKVEEKYKILLASRAELDAALELPLEQRDLAISDRFFEASSNLIGETQNFISSYSRAYRSIDAAVYRQMTFKYYLWALAEYTGQEYAMIGKMIAGDIRPTPELQEKLLLLRGHIEYGWSIVRRYTVGDDMSKELLPLMEEAHTHYSITFDETKDLFYTLRPVTDTAGYPITIEMWLGMASQVVDSLLQLQDEILKEAERSVQALEDQAKRAIFISLFIFLCALVVSIYCWLIIAYKVAKPVNAMVDALYKATHENIFEMPKIAYQDNEIGKLARVLEAFQKSAQKMKRSNEELERFAFIAAHDLKSPLRAVDNLSQWLEEDLEGGLSEKNKKYMDELRKRVRLMDKLLDDTLEYARMDARMDSKNNEIMSGKMLMEEIVTLVDPAKGISIKIHERLAGIWIQKFPLQQVLFNLVSNAVKYHDRLEGVVEIDVQENKDEYIFTVKDDGPGIEPQYHQKIFEMFQTLQPADKSKGRGMGLAVVKKIVITNGGNISVESNLGKGAIFRFTWPKTVTDMKEEQNADIRRRHA